MTEKAAAYFAFVEDGKSHFENPLCIIEWSDGKISAELDHAAGRFGQPPLPVLW